MSGSPRRHSLPPRCHRGGSCSLRPHRQLHVLFHYAPKSIETHTQDISVVSYLLHNVCSCSGRPSRCTVLGKCQSRGLWEGNPLGSIPSATCESINCRQSAEEKRWRRLAQDKSPVCPQLDFYERKRLTMTAMQISRKGLHSQTFTRLHSFPPRKMCLTLRNW